MLSKYILFEIFSYLPINKQIELGRLNKVYNNHMINKFKDYKFMSIDQSILKFKFYNTYKEVFEYTNKKIDNLINKYSNYAIKSRKIQNYGTDILFMSSKAVFIQINSIYLILNNLSIMSRYSIFYIKMSERLKILER
jgi:hypothetical protein